MKVIIRWRSLTTGKEGQGQPIDKDSAETALRLACKEFPELVHWIEPVPCPA